MRQTPPRDFESVSGDSAYKKIRLDLTVAARRWRRRSELATGELAQRNAVSAEIPAGPEVDPCATLDSLIRLLLALGATPRDIALELVRDS